MTDAQIDSMLTVVRDYIAQAAHRPSNVDTARFVEHLARNATQALMEVSYVHQVRDKERAIYWLLHAHTVGAMDAYTSKRIANALDDLGYAPGSERALTMLELGEPGQAARRAG